MIKLNISRNGAIGTFVALLGIFVLYQHIDISDKATYVTSSNCQECHPVRYQSWRTQTLHPIMFHPVNNPDDIKGDFDNNNPVVTFKKKDIEFVIGNKWEQVYARMIDGEYYPFPAKWLITTQQWIPYKVNNWRQTPLSTNCNGCHTTGFNAETLQFSEFGIGCEACHGPASKHIEEERMESDWSCKICHFYKSGDDHQTQNIIVSRKNSVCGQCHSRGQQQSDDEHLQTSFRFPLNMTPGDDLPNEYQPSTQANDKKGKHWWAIGLSKNRHQEFADFSVSAHNRALEDLKAKHSQDRGTLKDDCLKCHSADYRLAKDDNKPTLETAQLGLTCVVCHEPHGLARQFSALQAGPYQCGNCHVDSFSHHAAERGKPHYPCSPSEVKCADCHMPYIVKSGGTYPIRSHAFKIVPPHVSETVKMPNSCQNGGCHSEQSLEWLNTQFDKHYPDYDKP